MSSVGLYAAMSGLKLKDDEMDVIAHNLANSSTPGFKERRLSFEAMLIPQLGDSIDPVQTPFAKVSEYGYDFSMGPLSRTGSSLDLALRGNGFFEVEANGKTYYTRSGQFALDNAGNLVTHNGYRVNGTSGSLQVTKPGDIEVGIKGQMSQNGVSIGSIKVIEFQNPQDLKAVGSNLYEIAGSASPVIANQTEVIQGSLEQSNTSVMRNLVRLIESSKQFQTYKKVIDSYGKFDQGAAEQLGSLS